ncbi:SdpI family protein [Clostridium botulinum]|uniref:SdpI family protein n=1 Tax=Clostridium botulinum TaxID=1491 RepID=A0A9Q1UZN9_CLOBO|nr:SdpI family protein [Clostridium botulinum]AEB76469.1 hypothetical protein CbC4_1795 [Clostridium botulinum BKT015925]KEI01027.1 hypothetical protein Z953_09200 [Clostridium botulinum D str. 16868]KEI04792.1 hypothetical protein Y848_12845 [Clostridium botulinum C/D str. Sp77]KLU75971.1 hypothetical protein CBC3_05755 [Clostridium botulinum V891]KOA75458.1 hypothetical protein ADU78_08055 [Clostridium botulinum]
MLKNCSVGIILVIAGLILKLVSTQKNGLVGYRTTFSMKNDDTWKEANEFASILMMFYGVVSIILASIITVLNKDNMNISLKLSSIVSFMMMIACIFSTEIHLRRMFHKNGKRKE